MRKRACIVWFALVAGGAIAGEADRFRVVLRRARLLRFPGQTDSNSPAHWAGDTLYLFNSAGHPFRSSGASLTALGEAQRCRYDNEVNGGRWIECTWKAGGGTLYGWYHNEPHGLCPGTTLTAPRIGAVLSSDDGATWKDLGIVLESRPGTLECGAKNGYFAGGNGDFSVMLDPREELLYFFFGAYAGEVTEQGVAMARMRWADRDAPAGRVWKWHERGWGERGLGGRLTPVFPAAIDWAREDADAFWGPSVHWNTHLRTYVMLLNRTAERPGWPQEGIYASFNDDLSQPAAWTRPKRVRHRGAWYPQVVGLEKGGTDKLAGRVARFFMGGISEWEIVLDRHGEPAKALELKAGDLEAGLTRAYYKLERLVDFPDVSGRLPDLLRADACIDGDESDEPFAGDEFFVRWTGYVRVPREGTYTFHLESDDGARLAIGDELVVDNGGVHPLERQSGEIRLRAGYHSLRVEWFEHTGQAGCRLLWEGPGIGESLVPEGTFFHRR